MVSSTNPAAALGAPPRAPPRPPPARLQPRHTVAGRVERVLAAHIPDDYFVVPPSDAREHKPAALPPPAPHLHGAVAGFVKFGALRVWLPPRSSRPRRQQCKTPRCPAPATPAPATSAPALVPPPAPVIGFTPAPSPPPFDELDCDLDEPLCL